MAVTLCSVTCGGQRGKWHLGADADPRNGHSFLRLALKSRGGNGNPKSSYESQRLDPGVLGGLSRLIRSVQVTLQPLPGFLEVVGKQDDREHLTCRFLGDSTQGRFAQQAALDGVSSAACSDIS